MHIDTSIGTFQLNNQQDNEIIREILIENQYSIGDKMDLSGNVLDIGAHIGIFTKYAISRKCKVIAVEPEEKNFKLLKINAPEAVHIKKAVSSLKEAFLNVHEWRGELHRLDTVGTPVETVTLDELIKEPIHLLKMDIEGGEYDALYNCRKIEMVDQIAMEYHFGIDKACKLIQFLEARGFEPLYIKGEAWGILLLKRL